ncbi:hypothetical protein RF11_15541 [Thelohanellus kitauei]|uniref:Uncharacterized protein n=1 Tax=Thelohanellus kitauei TaxID=669202 RepID=A0A0C2N220_THEKT|nr:hypothetical protein RF11_15541 [Thelohanellus kitauei]
MKNLMADSTRFFESYIDTSKTHLLDVLDILKKRAELEIEYQRSLKKLMDRLSDKNLQILATLRAPDDESGTEYSPYQLGLLVEKFFEISERNSRLIVDEATPVLCHALESSLDLLNSKSTLTREVFSIFSEHMHTFVATNAADREKYLGSFLREVKSRKNYDSKLKKTKKQAEDRIRKVITLAVKQ